MARKNHNELVKCEYCGEMYSVTYKHCPFCNEDGTGSWDEPEAGETVREAPRRAGGGKRLAGGRGPSIKSIIWGILSLALIISAVGIVFSIIHSTLGSRKPTAESDPPVVESTAPTSAVTETAAPAESSAPAETAAPTQSAAPVESNTPSVVTPTVDVIKPTAFTLNREDFTFDKVGQTFDMKVKFTPADATAEVQWKSSDPNIASVTWDGKVIAVSQGTVTLTATVEGVGSKTCICRCNFTSSSSGSGSTVVTPVPATSSTPSSGAKLTLNREDFTLSHAGETFRMVVSGTSSPVVWTTSNTSVASISADGLVTAVGGGTCKVTATVDGKTLTCIVRCSF